MANLNVFTQSDYSVGLSSNIVSIFLKSARGVRRLAKHGHEALLQRGLMLSSFATLYVHAFFFLPADELTIPLHAQEVRVQEAYNALLDSLARQPLENRIPALQFFLHRHPNCAAAYAKLLECYFGQNQLAYAEAFFDSISKSPQHAVPGFWMLAKVFVKQERIEPARAAFTKALAVTPPSLLLLTDFTEFCQRNQSQFDPQAVIAATVPRREDRQSAKALLRYHRQDYAQALEFFQKQLAQSPANLTLLQLVGDCLLQMRRNLEAAAILQKGLAQAGREKDFAAQAWFLTSLGLLKQREGIFDPAQYQNAESFYQSAYALAARYDEVFNLQRVYGYRGQLLYQRDKYEEAEVEFRNAIATAQRTDAQNDAATWHMNYGQLLYEQLRFAEAIAAYNKSEKLARASNNAGILIHLQIKLATLWSYLDQTNVARALLQDARHAAQQHQNTELEQRAEVEIAVLEAARDDKLDRLRAAYLKFIAYLKQNFPSEVHAYLAVLADTFAEEGDFAEARHWYTAARREAERLHSNNYKVWYELEIANCDIALGNFSEAMPQYAAVLESARKDGNPDLLFQAYAGRADAYEQLQQPDSTIRDYTRAVQSIEPARKHLSADQLRIGYLSERAEAYRKLAELYFERYESSGQQADWDSLFRYAQMPRGRALHDLRRQGRANANSPASQSEYLQAGERLRSLQRRLCETYDAEARKRLLDDLTIARFSLIANRLRIIQQDRAAPAATLAPTLKRHEAQSVLQKERMAVLLYHIGAAHAFAVAMTGTESHAIRLNITADSLSALIASLLTPFHGLTASAVSHVPFRATLAHRLYNLLVKPVEQALKLPERLLIIPDLALMGLPFEMLLTSPDSLIYTPKDYPVYAEHFLAQRYAIGYSPAVWLLQDSLPAKSSNMEAFLLANPANKCFPPLSFAELEAKRLQKVLPRPREVRRENATQSAFLEMTSTADVLHFATHAFADTAFDAFSGLALALSDKSDDEGLLMGYEIADLELHCDLVTMSACETGVGKRVSGEGVLGLPRLFLGAGAKSTLVSLWKVDDRFASELMPKFYAAWYAQKLPKSEALARATRAILNAKAPQPDHCYYQHPFYWASFILYGDPGIHSRAAGRGMETALGVIVLALLLLAAGGLAFFRQRRR